MSSLIVLFGHENDCDGNLSKVAVQRCEKAIQLFGKVGSVSILPTGCRGRFNPTDKPHAVYLTTYLKDQKIPGKCILPGTDSTNTLEDCLCARKVAIDNGVSEVYLVTSDYHMPRVLFISEQVLRGLTLHPIEASTKPPSIFKREKRRENRSFERQRREWVSAPLYEKGGEFPKFLHEAAADEHRHYDTVSLAVVTAMIAVTGYLLFSTQSEVPRSYVLWAAAGLNLFFLVVYERAAQAARTARRVMRFIEIGFGRRGFSAAYNPEGLFRRWLPDVRNSVLILGGVLTALLFFLGVMDF